VDKILSEKLHNLYSVHETVRNIKSRQKKCEIYVARLEKLGDKTTILGVHNRVILITKPTRCTNFSNSFWNKIEKLVHLVGFIIRIYHDARSPERQIR